MALQSPPHLICLRHKEAQSLKVMGRQVEDHAYLFKSSHLLLDSVHKSPLYYKAKREKIKHFFSTHKPRNNFKTCLFQFGTDRLAGTMAKTEKKQGGPRYTFPKKIEILAMRNKEQIKENLKTNKQKQNQRSTELF